MATSREYPISDNIRNIVKAYRFSKNSGIPFDCPFCQKIVPVKERHYEDGVCRVLGGLNWNVFDSKLLPNVEA